MAGDDAGASGSGVAPTAAAAASAAARHHHLPWEAVLHLVVPHLREQDDRATVRKVSREWKAAADAAWTRGAVWSDEPFPPFVWRLRELCLVDDYSGGSSRTTVQIFRLTKQPLTALRALVLSAELGFQGSLGTSVLEHLAICGMPRLQRLELQNVVVAPRSGNLACLACFNELTELSLSRLSSLPNDASALAVGGVHHLTGLRSLQVTNVHVRLLLGGCWVHRTLAHTAPCPPPCCAGPVAAPPGPSGSAGAGSLHRPHAPVVHGRRHRRRGPLAGRAYPAATHDHLAGPRSRDVHCEASAH